VIVVTGGAAGPKAAFCSGADLAPASGDDERERTTNEILDDKDWIGQFLVAFRLHCDKPVIAAINGVAVGAGVALALCADLRIAAQSAALHPGYIRAGTSPDGGLSWTLPTLLGHEAALRFLWNPRMVPAEEAQARGLVGEVVADDAFSDAVARQAAQLAALAPLGVRQTKRLVVRATLGAEVHSHLRDELSYVRRGLGSEDGKEAVRAIFEKRTPTFHGR
jgi:2-(1,2-epoxy-1,2-dihydrophenyl)acetyl-CoA isomerase